MIPSNMEKTKKRVIIQNVEGRKGKTFADYQDEFEYIVSAGIALNVQAISNPVFPLIQSASKNLLKLYLNDVGILSNILYSLNILAVMEDNKSINLGALYENVVASELAAHGHRLFYYDNRKKGEVDFLVDDYEQDSNPRRLLTLHDFQSCTFDHSDISPIALQTISEKPSILQVVLHCCYRNIA